MPSKVVVGHVVANSHTDVRHVHIKTPTAFAVFIITNLLALWVIALPYFCNIICEYVSHTLIYYYRYYYFDFFFALYLFALSFAAPQFFRNISSCSLEQQKQLTLRKFSSLPMLVIYCRCTFHRTAYGKHVSDENSEQEK